MQKRGAPPDALAALQTVTLQPRGGGGAPPPADACAICLDEPRAGDQVCRLGCAHVYHAVCIKRWLQQKNSCPVCAARAV